MAYYRSVGQVPRKRHTRHEPGGVLHAEELMGEHGFAGPSSLLYHRRSPSALESIEAVAAEPLERLANAPVRPHHLRTGQLDLADDADLVNGRRVLLANDQVRLSVVLAMVDSGLYRDAVGDQLVFVHRGSARLETSFGTLEVRAGDYVLVPTATTHRWVLDEPVSALVLEATGHVRFPDRYRNESGQLVEGSPFSERDLRGPDGPLLVEGTSVPVLVRTRAGLARHVHAHHPFDVVGWDGHLWPLALSIHDFEPIVGRIHQPPPVHQTFAGPGFVVCSFVPRPLDFDAAAVPVPYHHANVDSDEVLFYAEGEFTSRAGSGIGVGSLSLHPAGFVHGPQPGSVERATGKPRTEEVAVMLDTFSPLDLTPAALAISDDAYVGSWNR